MRFPAPDPIITTNQTNKQISVLIKDWFFSSFTILYIYYIIVIIVCGCWDSSDDKLRVKGKGVSKGVLFCVQFSSDRERERDICEGDKCVFMCATAESGGFHFKNKNLTNIYIIYIKYKLVFDLYIFLNKFYK